jgi:4-amino-4-deoxy-L-arabinose transferase-like glycosyltransferase
LVKNKLPNVKNKLPNYWRRIINERMLSICCLWIVLAVAFAIRYRGITFGFPLITHPDEPFIVESAINIITTKDLNPHMFLYPSLYIYMQTLVYISIFLMGKLSGIFDRFFDIGVTTFYFWGRMLTIIISVWTIYFVYLLGTLLFNRFVAVISTLFIAFSLLHVSNSYTITTDSPMAFWIILSFFVSAVNYINGPKLRYYILNGALIGCAVSTKYTAVWCLLPLIYVHLHHTSFSLVELFDRKLLLGLLSIPAAFVLTSPFSILDFNTFAPTLVYQHRAYSLGHAGFESDAVSYGYYFQSLVRKYGIIPFIIAGIGMIFSFIHDTRKTALLLCFPIPYFLFIGAYKVHFDRNIVCLVPFLALMSGYGIFQLTECFKNAARNKVIKFTLYLLLIISVVSGVYAQASKVVAHTRRITLPDTRWISKIWIEENIPAGAIIAREHYTPPIDNKRFKVTYLGYYGLIKASLDGYDYIIASSLDYYRFFKGEKRYPVKSRKYKEIFSKYELVKEFVPDNIKVSGPRISIYKIH